MAGKLKLPLYYRGAGLGEMERKLAEGYLSSSGWRESAERKLALRDGKPLPWFTYSAIAFLEEQISPDLAIFEYGGGQSTLYWAERVRRVVSVDHDPAFAEHVRSRMPGNVDFQLVEENAPLPESLRRFARERPWLADPERTERSWRSGQLNQPFETYALKVLEHAPGSFDIVIVDGMARVLSTWAAIRSFPKDGFIVFDNADRDFYKPAYDMLEEAGYRRLAFWGIGPINTYEWCTAVYYQPKHFTGTAFFRAGRGTGGPQSRPVAAAAAPAPGEVESRPGGLGILVLGYNRPFHLQAVLESLRLQGRIGDVHVWIDGTQGRGEFADANAHSVRIAERYAVRERRVMHGHLGIEKMMLDALSHVSALHDRVLVLEDDCFPLEGAVDAFETELAAVAARDDIYSVYGHHFGTEPRRRRDFSRFQGWGWAAHSRQIRRILPVLRDMFLADEETYLARVAAQMTRRIRKRLDRTPGRDVLRVLESGFSWDSATALVTASLGMEHRRTAEPVVKNTGITPGIGHFREDAEPLRKPPFNMITLEEAWDHFDRTTRPVDYARPSYGLDGLDLKILERLAGLLGGAPGFFVEIGAYDGQTQSNSVLLEKAGWKGMLIEANPGNYARCLRARPKAIVEFAACVGADYPRETTIITDVGLMSMTGESAFDERTRASWLERGAGFTARPPQDIEVPATTLGALLDRHGIGRVDALLLDVEGAEVEVLKGLDFSRQGPRVIVAEDAHDDAVERFLAGHGYRMREVLLERRHTRDRLYMREEG